jgi:hypothetical protein
VAAHLAHTYGGMQVLTRPIRGVLAPWQERRSKEILNGEMDALEIAPPDPGLDADAAHPDCPRRLPQH